MNNTSDVLIKIQNYGMLSDEPDAEFMECYVSGLYYYITDDLWDEIKEDMELYLEKDNNNQYDHNAITVNLYNDEDECYTIGYIPSKKKERLASIIDMGWGDILGCRVSEKSDVTGGQKAIKLSVFIKNISEFKKTFLTKTYRAAYIDEEGLRHINKSLIQDGYVYFRWGGFSPQNHNLPNVKEKVFFIHRNEGYVEIYLMSVVARGDKCSPFLTNPDELYKPDDCSPFILTNIKGPVKVDIEKIDFLEDEDFYYGQPETILSDDIAQKLKTMINI